MSSATDRLFTVIAPEVHALGMDVEEVTLTPAGKHRILRVSIDKDDGVGVDDIATVSRAISSYLDREETQHNKLLGSAPYTLEVTSRGADKPLTLPRHWRRNRGRRVNVQTVDGQQLSGWIADCDDECVQMELDGTRHTIDYDSISRAVIQIEFKRKDT